MAPGWLRSAEPEILDVEGPQGRGLAILADLARWNKVSGWERRHVVAVARHWEALGRPRPFRVLDVGTGHGGLLVAMADWAEANGVELALSGVDLHPAYVQMAAVRIGERGRVFQGDATRLEAEDGAWHLVTCALMMHHLPMEVRGALVAEMRRVARSAYIFDLECTLYGTLGARVILPLAGLGADSIADGVLSVRRGATFSEFQALVAPLPVRAVRVFPSAMATLPGAPLRPPPR